MPRLIHLCVLGLGAIAMMSACSSDDTSSGDNGTSTSSTGGDAGGETGAASSGDGGATEAGTTGGTSSGTTSSGTSGGTTGTSGTTNGGDAGAADAGTGGSTGTSGATGTSDGGARESGLSDASDGAVSPLFSFFVTSSGTGANGGNLGGLTGADIKCQTLAAAVGAGARTWHAYLSVSSPTPVNARDRIGNGPWYNVKGVKIADNLTQLHEEGDAGMNNINGATALDEMGNPVPTMNTDAGMRNEHDILTGSGPDGRALPASPDVTCAGWTSNAASVPADAGGDAGGDGGAVPVAEVGHVNRMGTNAPPASMSWNSSHTTPGCSQADIQRVGGAGRLYCFATN